MLSSVKKSGVYKIFNIKTHKIYIGSSKNCEIRFRRHKTDLRFNRHPNTYLQRAWNKYGENSFKFEIIEEVSIIKDQLVNREQFWIDFYQSFKRRHGYNLLPTAYSSLGVKRDFSPWLIGNKYSVGHTPWNKGKKLSKQIKEKFRLAKKRNPSRAWLGKSRSEETKQKIREKLLGRKLSKQHIRNIKLNYRGNQYHKVG